MTILSAAVESGLPQLAIAFAVGKAVEHIRPVRRSLPFADIAFGGAYSVCNLAITAGLRPAALLVGTKIVHLFAAPLMTLPTSGVLAVAGFCLYLLSLDLLEYAVHRAQHVVPALWKMHSLHHSEESFNVLTTLLHFWAETPLKIALVYPILGILFSVPPVYYFVITIIYFFSTFFQHLNLQLELGRWSLWVTGPQYHRIHHSKEPCHIDRNFADLLPVWDVLFGTVVRPAKQEFPDTGLVSGQRPAGLLQAFIWPFIEGQATPQRHAGQLGVVAKGDRVGPVAE